MQVCHHSDWLSVFFVSCAQHATWHFSIDPHEEQLQGKEEDNSLPNVEEEDKKWEEILQRVQNPTDAAGQKVVAVAKCFLDAAIVGSNSKWLQNNCSDLFPSIARPDRHVPSCPQMLADVHSLTHRATVNGPVVSPWVPLCFLALTCGVSHVVTW